MYRTQIYLDVSQVKLLKKVATARRTTLSELIREAVWSLISTYQKPKKDPLQEIMGLYENKEDAQGSLSHDDLYE